MDPPQIPSDEIQSSPPPTITPNSIPGDDTQPPLQQSPPPQNPSPSPPPNPDPPQTLEIDDPDLDPQDDPEEDHEGMSMTLSPSHHPLISDSNLEEREALPPSRSSRKVTTTKGRKKKKGGLTQRKLATIEKKAQDLAQKLKVIPFVPSKTLDFASHEENLRRLGLWDFAHLEFDRKFRVDLLAKLIVGYNLQIRGSLVDDVKIMVNQADLARALNLPSKKAVASWGDEEVWPADFVAFVEDFVSSWMLLHEDTWMLPPEVMSWIGVIKEGHPEKVDYGKIIWFMVRREILKGAQLESCYYASHLQHLIRVQKEGLFREKSPNEVEEVIMLKEDEEEEGDVKMEECDEVKPEMRLEDIQPSSVEGIGSVLQGEQNADNVGVVGNADCSIDSVGLVEIQEKAVESVKSSESPEKVVVEHVEKAVECVESHEKAVDHVENPEKDVEDVEKAVERVESPEKVVDHVESPEKVVDHVESLEKAVEHVENLEKAVVDQVENMEMVGDDMENIETTCDHVESLDNTGDHFGKLETANDHVDIPEAATDLVEKLETAGDLVNDMNDVGDNNVEDMKIEGDNVEDMKFAGDDVEDLKTEDDNDNVEGTKITGDDEIDSKTEDDVVDSADDGQIHETSGNGLMDFEPMRADDEQDLWDLSRKDGEQDHFLRHCTMTEAEPDEDHTRQEEDLHLEEVDDDEDEDDEHVQGFDALQKCNSFNGHLLQAMEPSQMPYTASDFVNNDLMLGGPSSFFSNAPKRELDHDPEIPDSHKRMRTEADPSWDQKPPDFDFCVDQMQQWIEKTRMAYTHSQETLLSQQQALFDELGAKEHTIQQLKLSIEDLNRRRQADLARYDNELYTMNSVVAGYRKALRSTQEKFAEYRKHAALVEEPLYKDAGEGGVVKTVVELEKERLKREEEERILCAQILETFTQTVGRFEVECTMKLEGLMERVEMYRARVNDIEKDVELLRESMKKRKAPETVAPS